MSLIETAAIQGESTQEEGLVLFAVALALFFLWRVIVRRSMARELERPLWSGRIDRDRDRENGS